MLPHYLSPWTGWSPSGNTASQKLVLTGASTIAPLAGEIARRFETLHPGVRVDVQTGGSARGNHDSRKGIADIGMVSRMLKPEEKDLQAHTYRLGRRRDNPAREQPIAALSRQQLIDIYTGKIINWKAVGGGDAPITVVNKAEGRSTLELFLSYLKLKNSDIKPHVIIGDNSQGIKTVAGNPNAIGYVSIGTAEYETEHGTPIKLLPLDGIAATVANVRNGTFPLSRPLNLVTQALPKGLAREFIEFAAPSRYMIWSRRNILFPSAPVDALMLWLLRGAASLATGMVLLILLFLAVESWPALRHISVGRFLADPSWNPGESLYNLAPMLSGTLWAAGGALLLATPLGIASALFIVYYAPPRRCKHLPAPGRVAGGYSVRSLRFLGADHAGATDQSVTSAGRQSIGWNSGSDVDGPANHRAYRTARHCLPCRMNICAVQQRWDVTLGHDSRRCSAGGKNGNRGGHNSRNWPSYRRNHGRVDGHR